jgi:hypothetical protein
MGALVSIGIPEDSVVQYEADLKANRFLLIASGTAAASEASRRRCRTRRKGRGPRSLSSSNATDRSPRVTLLSGAAGVDVATAPRWLRTMAKVITGGA